MVHDKKRILMDQTGDGLALQDSLTRPFASST